MRAPPLLLPCGCSVPPLLPTLLPCMQITSKEEVLPGSREEVEMRASTVVAVSRLQRAINLKFGPTLSPTLSLPPCAVQLDWWLWHQGERERKQHPPHHRTLTVFY